jgi:cytoskeletal protein RodZ
MDQDPAPLPSVNGPPPTLGQRLRQAREARRLTVEQAGRLIHIKPHYINALEAGDFESLPSLAQARGFLRSYAALLGVETAEVKTAPPAPRPPLAAPPLAAPPLAAPLPAAAAASRQVYGEIGESLCSRRQLLGLTLDDVERHTHLRQHHLQALEAGLVDDLPSPVQGRGMLKNYAVFLGLDPDPLLLKLASGLQEQRLARQAAIQPEQPAQPRPAPPGLLRRVVGSEWSFLLLFAAGLVAFVIWAVGYVSNLSADRPAEPSPPPIAEMLLSQGSPTPQVTPSAAATPTPEAGLGVLPSPTAPVEQPPPPAELAATAGAGEIQVYLTVRQRAWLRVLVDGEVEFEGRVLPGTAYQFSGGQRVELLTGNGAALQVFFNQADLGVLGDFGEVVNLIFTAEGILTPTPTIIPTPTTGPPPTAVPTPAGTP